MSDSERWIVKCQDPADGSGDVMVDLPKENLAKFGLDIGNLLTV
ncbi:hypothetical protein [Pseudomonas azerbaijanoccidentalis]|jgi:antitoxin ChpS